MHLQYSEPATNAIFHLHQQNPGFDRQFFRDRQLSILTIAWNRGPDQEVTIENEKFRFPANSILPLMVNNTFSFEEPGNVVAWQYNRDFYCLETHDQEVSCIGFLFFGSHGTMFITMADNDVKKLQSLLLVFVDEFDEKDNIQGDMLRMLLKRLIILVTRLAKKQYLSHMQMESSEFDVVRQFNLLVEKHHKEHHQVQEYAAMLNKSPKTLSNLFARYNQKTPLQVIQDRLVLEAKRLFYYTDKSAKEVAFELGFEDPANFSRFFKGQTSSSPSDFKQNLTAAQAGKN